MNYQHQQYQQYDERSQQESRQQIFYEGGYQPAQPIVGEFSPYTQQPMASNEPPLSIYPSTINAEQPSYRYQTIQPIPQASSDNSKVFAVFSYMVGWFSGLLVLLFAGQNRYVRFHALQSLLFFGAINLIDIFMFSSFGWWRFMSSLTFRPFSSLIWLLFIGIFFIVNVVAFVGWIVGMVQAASGKYYHMPIFGRIAARAIGQDTTLK